MIWIILSLSSEILQPKQSINWKKKKSSTDSNWSVKWFKQWAEDRRFEFKIKFCLKLVTYQLVCYNFIKHFNTLKKKQHVTIHNPNKQGAANHQNNC